MSPDRIAGEAPAPEDKSRRSHSFMKCQHCGTRIRFSDAKRGKLVPCPKCRAVIELAADDGWNPTRIVFHPEPTSPPSPSSDDAPQKTATTNQAPWLQRVREMVDTQKAYYEEAMAIRASGDRTPEAKAERERRLKELEKKYPEWTRTHNRLSAFLAIILFGGVCFWIWSASRPVGLPSIDAVEQQRLEEVLAAWPVMDQRLFKLIRPIGETSQENVGETIGFAFPCPDYPSMMAAANVLKRDDAVGFLRLAADRKADAWPPGTKVRRLVDLNIAIFVRRCKDDGSLMDGNGGWIPASIFKSQ